LLLHIVLAVVVNFTEDTAKYFLLVVIIYFLYRIFSNANKNNEVLFAAAYMAGYEVFSRMNGGAFSYEFAKYSVIGFLMIGMFFKGFNRNSWAYIFYILLLIPGIIFSVISLNYDTKIGNAIGFNLSGPICLGISALYCYERKISARNLQKILQAVLLPVISMTVYLFLHTPSIKSIIRNTASNFEASGGFGPNQVATVLGLGVFILFTRLFLIKDKLINGIDLVLLGLVGYRAMVTFSRGGVITAVLCSLIFLAIYFLSLRSKERTSLIPKLVIISMVLVVTWLLTSFLTLGLIDKRYANQDSLGRDKEDFSTGRTELFNAELLAFYENPITGIGVGKIKEYRLERTGVESASHNEISRILSEHGIFGLIAILLLIITPLILRLKNKTNIYLYSLLMFWFLTINHSSMRIAAPAFIYGLCLISIYNEKRYSIHRK
jgi:O-antigen ligase